MSVFMVERDLKGISMEALGQAQTASISKAQEMSASGTSIKYIRSTFESVGTKLCHAPHSGTVREGRGAVRYEDGCYLDLVLGTVFHTSIVPRDSWVIGDIPYVSLQILKPLAI